MLTFSTSRYSCTAFDATLSMMWKMGLNPLFVRYVICCLNQLTIFSSAKFFTGVASIVFVVKSYMMKIATIQSMYLMGNLPVKSTYIVPSFVFILPL